MRLSTIWLPILASLAAAPAPAQVESSPAAFRAIELRGGGLVTLRPGPAYRVTQRGAPRQIRSERGTLVIDRCSRPCAGGHRTEIDIVAPEISALAVTDGGLIQVLGGFRPQAAVAVAVSSGGTIDLRPLEAAQVSAAVSQGGRILARPGRDMAAAVTDGGIITYWGDASVRSSVRRGGAVVRGAEGDLLRPVSQLHSGMPAPPVPPVPPLPVRGR